MEIVKVRGKAKAFNGAIDVLLYMRSRVCDGAAAENIESAFGSNCYKVTTVNTIICKVSRVAVEDRRQRTEDLVAEVVFPDEVSKELLVDSGLVDNLGDGRGSMLAIHNMGGGIRKGEIRAYRCVPKCTTQLNCFKQDRLRFFEAQVSPQSKADAHGTEARRRGRYILEGEPSRHAE